MLQRNTTIISTLQGIDRSSWWANVSDTHTPVSDMAGGSLRTETDESLACRAAMSPVAMAELYNRYQLRIFQYCRHRISDPEQAKDIVSEIFLKVLVDLGKGTKTKKFRPWIFTIAHNEVANAYRDKRSERSLDGAQLSADPGPSPEDVAVAASNLDFLRTLMKQLKESHRVVIELRMAGLTTDEVSNVLRKPYFWVSSNQHRGYAQLRKLVEDYRAMGDQA
jgi:RNA polymerase sigma-70 factor, ECF subfamily